MLKPLTTAAVIATLLLPAAWAGEATQPPAKLDEAKLIAVLKSPDAAQFDKAEACRLLQRCATRAAVPALAALLADEKLSHMARYALEPLPDPAADDALRAALATTRGRLLAGVATSLGVRRDPKAVDPLAKLLADADADVAQAAAQALGDIGTPEAATALQAAVANAPAARQVAMCEGLFRAAERLAAAGKKDLALGAYECLRSLKPAAQQVRMGALRGAILTRGDEGIPLLLEAVRGSDPILLRAATRAAMELPGPAVVKALADELPKLPAENQILVTFVLGKRGDAAAVAAPALIALAKKGEPSTSLGPGKAARLAAIRALPELGSGEATKGLLELMADPEPDVAAAARDALTSLAAPEVDAALAAMLDQGDAKTRAAAIEMLGERRVLGAMPALLKAAQDPDDALRAASIKVLAQAAGAAEFPQLLSLLLKAKSPADAKALEAALAAICTRESQPSAGKVVILKAVYGALPDGPAADVTKKVAQLVQEGATSVEASNGNFGDPANGIAKKLHVEYTVDGVPQTKTVSEGDSVSFAARIASPALVDALCGALPQAPAEAKLALLRVLRSAGGPKALASLIKAAAEDNAEVRDTALAALCEWPTADALPEVTRLAKTSKDARLKILALRGCFRLIPLQEAPNEQKLAALKDAMALAERTEEKRLALAALGAIPSPEALALIKPHLDTKDLKEEAAAATLTICERLLHSHPTQVVEALTDVAGATTNPQTAKRAKALLGQARRAAPKK